MTWRAVAISTRPFPAVPAAITALLGTGQGGYWEQHSTDVE